MKTMFFSLEGVVKNVYDVKVAISVNVDFYCLNRYRNGCRRYDHPWKCWYLIGGVVKKGKPHQTCGFPNKRLFSEEISCFMMVKQWKAHFRTFDVFTIFTCGDPWFLAFYEHKSYGLEKYARSQQMIVFSSHHRFLAGPLSRKRCFCKMAKIANI